MRDRPHYLNGRKSWMTTAMPALGPTKLNGEQLIDGSPSERDGIVVWPFIHYLEIIAMAVACCL